MGATVKTRRIGMAVLLAAALFLVDLALGAAQVAQAEEPLPSWVTGLNDRLPFSLNLTGMDVEVGVRGVGGDTDVAKFQEYRVIEDGIFVDHLRLFLEKIGRASCRERV